MEDATVQEEISKLQASLVVEEKPNLKPTIEFEDFEKADMRIGEVKHVEPVPKSNKLLKLEIDFGFEKRTIVSGIAKFYKPEDLVNKKVMAIINLKPAKIMGVESRGMLLSASDGKLLEVPFFNSAPNGSQIG